MSNIDIVSNMPFNDASGVAQFMLAHYQNHNQIGAALLAQYKQGTSTFGLQSPAAEQAWVDLMRAHQRGEQRQTPQPLADWLHLHATLHNAEYTIILPSLTQTYELEDVDFSDPEQFYDWLQGHQQIHDFEQGLLGFL
jgi:hypothetical protein